MLPFTLAVDFEGDQWTFFKPSLEELRDLYGIDVQELTIWRPLIEHAVEQLSAGKFISTEADAFWLPDTAGTDYRIERSQKLPSCWRVWTWTSVTWAIFTMLVTLSFQATTSRNCSVLTLLRIPHSCHCLPSWCALTG